MTDSAPWSSKHIVDVLCPPLEETGNPAQFYPVAGYPLGVKAKWEPTQEGSGKPYPAGGGKNLFRLYDKDTIVSANGLTAKFDLKAETLTVTGTSTKTDESWIFINQKAGLQIPDFTPGETYTLSWTMIQGVYVQIVYADSSGALHVLCYLGTAAASFTVPSDYAKFFGFQVGVNSTAGAVNGTTKIQLEKGSTATAYAPYENIRPIKGRDSVTVERCGQNVIEFLSTNDSNSDIKIAVDAEKNITLNGTVVIKNNISIGMCRLHWVAGKTYTMYVKKVGGSASLENGDGITFAYSLFTTDYEHYFRGSTTSTNLEAYIASNAALVETELIFMLQCWREGTVFNDFKFQIEVVPGTTAPTTYAPYTGQTATLTLPRTIYGGTVDAVTGEGQETWQLIDSYAGEDLPDKWISDRNVYATGTTPTIGAQVAYILTEPISFTVTGAQPISALGGVNAVLTDADSATVTGRADPIKRIIDLEDAVASMT